MMIRCKCGIWTQYGITCVACRSEVYRNVRPPEPKGEEGEEVVETEDLDEDDD